MCETLNNDMDLCLSSYKKWSTLNISMITIIL
jgi:hypothetical protein